MSIFEPQTPETDHPQKHTLAALLLDECKCGVGVDRVPAGASLSSGAGTSPAPVKKAASSAKQHSVAPLRATAFAVEIGEVSRFSHSAQAGRLLGADPERLAVRRELLGPAGSPRLAPPPCAGRRSKRPSTAWRESNPWHRLYRDVKQRSGKTNAAKSAVARKVLIAAWHVLSREQPFKLHHPSGKLPAALAA